MLLVILCPQTLNMVEKYIVNKTHLKTYTPNPHLYDYDWLVDNVKQLEKFMPGYVIDYGIKDNELYLETKIIPGKTDELWIELDKKQAQTFVHGIIDFCIEQYKATKL